MGRFKHIPLDRSKECIRLLRFVDRSPSSVHDHFVLETHDIAAAPRFVALSYTWGDSQPNHDIIVNGSLLSITENLRMALKALRSFFNSEVTVPDESGGSEDQAVTLPRDLLQENGYPLMWIDSICINQSDNLEKNHQVNLMGSIFSTADCVISWLGDEAHNSRCVMKAIRATTHRRHYSIEVEQAMRAFMMRPYWRRMWIIQEVILARDVVIVCGHEGAWWNDLVHFWYDPKFVSCAEGVREFSKRNSFQPLPFQSLRGPEGLAALIYARRARGDNVYEQIRPLSLHQLITTFSYGQCHDRRDRIYALLALVEPQAGVEPLAADYTISAEKLYYRVLGYAARGNHNQNWVECRRELGQALGSSAWAGTQAAKMHEVVSEIVEMENSHEKSLDFTFATGAANRRRARLDRTRTSSLTFTTEPAKRRKPLLDRTSDSTFTCVSDRELFEFALATEQRVFFTKARLCLAKHFGRPLDSMFSGGDWNYHDSIRFFEAFPADEDPETWRRFDNLLQRKLKLQPDSNNPHSHVYREISSDASRRHPATDPSMAPGFLDYLSACYISSERYTSKHVINFDR